MKFCKTKSHVQNSPPSRQCFFFFDSASSFTPSAWKLSSFRAASAPMSCCNRDGHASHRIDLALEAIVARQPLLLFSVFLLPRFQIDRIESTHCPKHNFVFLSS